MDCTEYLVPDSYNTRNIPRAAFVEDIGAFVGTFDGDCAACIASLQETLGKYNLMLDALRKQRDGLRASTAELRENLDAISHLQDRFEEASEVDVRYELAAGVYARARIPRTDRISLWLGSGVMVEYPPEEARALLSKNLAEADAAITDLEQNIQFLKEQATTTEVCISRVFNWDVQNRSHGRLPSES
ncbi:putative Prefoldin subunit 3 [Giardia muris]|uniref:Prefoldin subunit 3 n=1 Tax=Giardia muris TaxID=5742 RepID=A0A4Z1T8D2_GIAMU|nr:putative Prefoldin subunit 3 [Giardia muris]|eukprot:TNJ28771.1 putative Prefoldin subunit 3 [Giardia muris]